MKKIFIFLLMLASPGMIYAHTLNGHWIASAGQMTQAGKSSDCQHIELVQIQESKNRYSHKFTAKCGWYEADSGEEAITLSEKSVLNQDGVQIGFFSNDFISTQENIRDIVYTLQLQRKGSPRKPVVQTDYKVKGPLGTIHIEAVLKPLKR